MVVLDNLVVSTALPKIRVDLGASLGQREWTVNSRPRPQQHGRSVPVLVSGTSRLSPRSRSARFSPGALLHFRVSLAQFRGRPVVINIWAAWCAGSTPEARELQRFATAHPGLQLLGIDYQDSKAGARAFSRRYGQEWPSIFDPTGRISRRLPLLGLPTTFFLDRRHRIVRVLAGAGTYAEFRAAYRLAYR
jgi:thiol-disulfide isomerase/thioredoxin